jgi:hypothetical protein
MPLSLTPKRAAWILIIDDEPAEFFMPKSLLTRSHNWKTAPIAFDGIDYLKVNVENSFATRAMRSVRGHNIA